MTIGKLHEALYDWYIKLFVGHPFTKEEILQERLRVCSVVGISPNSVSNFWGGIKEYKPETILESVKGLSTNIEGKLIIKAILVRKSKSIYKLDLVNEIDDKINEDIHLNGFFIATNENEVKETIKKEAEKLNQEYKCDIDVYYNNKLI